MGAASAASRLRTSCSWLAGSSSDQHDTKPAANSSRAIVGCTWERVRARCLVLAQGSPSGFLQAAKPSPQLSAAGQAAPQRKFATPHLCEAVAGAQRGRGRLRQQLHTEVAHPLGPVVLGHTAGEGGVRISKCAECRDTCERQGKRNALLPRCHPPACCQQRATPLCPRSGCLRLPHHTRAPLTVRATPMLSHVSCWSMLTPCLSLSKHVQVHNPPLTVHSTPMPSAAY